MLAFWLAAIGCGHSPEFSAKLRSPDTAKQQKMDGASGAILQHTRPVPPEAYQAFCAGLVAAASGHWERAATEFQHVMAIDPEADPPCRHFLNCCDRLADPDRALPVLEQWSKRREGDFRTHVQIGAYLDRWHKTSQAIAEFEKSSQCHIAGPDRPEYHLILQRLAALYSDSRNLEGTLRCYERMRAAAAIPEAALEYKIGEAFYEHGQYEQAAQHFTRVQDHKRDFAPALRYLTICYEETGQYGQAIQTAQRYLGLVEPAAAWPIQSLLADLYDKTQQPDKAQHHRAEVQATLTERIGAGSRNLHEHMHLAKLLRMAQRFDAAIDVLCKAKPLVSPERSPHVAATFHLALADAYYDNKDDANVEKELRRVLELDPQRHEASNFLGYFYAERGMCLDQAEQLVNRALELDPKNGAYLDSLGWVFYRQAATAKDFGKLRKALDKLLEAAAQLSDPVIRDHIGDVYYAMGNWDQAERHWELALALWKGKPRAVPGPKPVESKLKRLRQQRDSAQP